MIGRMLTATIAAMIAIAGLAPVAAAVPLQGAKDDFGLVDPGSGIWRLHRDGAYLTEFYFGNPGDYPFMGDWDCDGVDTPGLYRQSDGYVYLRNSNTAGIADVSFYFGDPGDVPIAGDFDADGCDTVSIYRPAEARFYIINDLGSKDAGLGAADYSFLYGDVGDKPFVGDFNGDGIDTVGLHRESTGFVYFRNSNTTGIADAQFYFGDPGDRFIAGDWTGDAIDSPGVFRPGPPATVYLRYANTQGNADIAYPIVGSAWLPVAGRFTLPEPPPPPVDPCDLTVRGLGDSPTGANQLREAITNASDGDTICVEPGTITLTRGELVVPPGKALTIRSLDADTITAIDANDTSRVLVVSPGADVTLKYLTLTGGRSFAGQPGAGIHNSGTLEIVSATITGNDANTYAGGGIYNTGTLLLDNAVITNNTSSTGGGLANGGIATAEVRDSTISGNTAGSKQGGGIANDGVVSVLGGVIEANSAFNGGGIYSTGTLTVDGAMVGTNSAFNGAGIHNAGGRVELSGSTLITENSGGVSGGGIYNSAAGSVTLSGTTTISKNVMEAGSGIANFGTLEMYDVSTIVENVAKDGTAGHGEGGGIRSTGTVRLFDNSSIIGNQAATLGGGIHSTAAVSLFDQSSITNNTASINGGGVYTTGTVSVFGTALIAANTPNDCAGIGCPP